jgi:hypothetical protein
MAFTTGRDLNLAAWIRGLNDETAYNSILIGYDSTITDNQSSDQGVYTSGVITAFPYLRSDGTPLIAGLGGAAQSLTQTFTSGAAAQGYTLTSRAAGATWTTAGGASPQAASEFVIGTGVARTASTVTDQASIAGFAALVECQPTINNQRGGTRNYVEVLGGDPFRLRETSVRMILRTFANTPDDMRIVGLRQLQGNGTLSTANTELDTITTLSALSGAGIKSASVTCGNGYGNPRAGLLNPTSTTTGTAYAFGYLGSRVYRTDSGNASPGVHIASIATGGHTIGQWNSALGISGTGTTPNPYMSAADAQEYVRLMCGLGTNRDFPTHVIIWDGHNPTTGASTPGNDEATEFAAGVQTLGIANRLASIDRLNAMADALSSPRPKVLFVLTPAHRNGYSGLMRNTWYTAVVNAAAQRGASVLDLHARTCPASIDQNAALPYSTLEPWFAKATSVNAQAGTTTGPVTVASPDWLHPGPTGARDIGQMFWQSLIAATGVYPGVQTVGNRQSIDVVSGRSRAFGVR